MSSLTDAFALYALGLPVEVETEHGWLRVMSWEFGRLHYLLAGHPERSIRLPEWAVPSFNVIRGYCDECARPTWRRRRCDHSWPTPIRPPDWKPPEARPIQGAVSCEDLVAALAAAGCQPVVRGAFKWRSLCPVCLMDGKRDRRLYVDRDHESGRDRLSSFCHCSAGDILAVLGLPTSRPRYAMAGKVDLDYVLSDEGQLRGGHAA